MTCTFTDYFAGALVLSWEKNISYDNSRNDTGATSFPHRFWELSLVLVDELPLDWLVVTVRDCFVGELADVGGPYSSSSCMGCHLRPLEAHAGKGEMSQECRKRYNSLPSLSHHSQLPLSTDAKSFSVSTSPIDESNSQVSSVRIICGAHKQCGQYFHFICCRHP